MQHECVTRPCTCEVRLPVRPDALRTRSPHNSLMTTPEHLHQVPVDLFAAKISPGDTEMKALAEPAFLGQDYVCAELPTYIDCARTEKQQALLERAYKE